MPIRVKTLDGDSEIDDSRLSRKARRLKEYLEKCPNDEVYESRLLAKALGYIGHCPLRGLTSQEPRLKGYFCKPRPNYTIWGHPEAIKTYLKEYKKAGGLH